MDNQKLIVDSGSTKADWVYLENAQVLTCQTLGFNPLTHERQDLQNSIQQVQAQLNIKAPLSIYYYGSGISTKTTQEVYEIFNHEFESADINITNDLLGAARAVCQNDPGIVCIAGTGSNACVYDGSKIINKINSLGYLLGDEGSGGHLAKKLIRDYFYHLLPSHLTRAFEIQYPDFNKNDFLDRLYKHDMPNAYLASFSKFLGERKTDPYVKSLLISCFRAFIRLHVFPFANTYKLPIYMIGSIAHHFKEDWISVIKEYGLEMGRFIEKPIAGLIEYHLDH